MKKYKVFVADADSALVNKLEHKIKKDSNIEYIYTTEMNLDSIGKVTNLHPDIITFDMFVPKNEYSMHHKDYSIDILIAKRLSKLGMPSGLSGYRYMISAIKLVLFNENALDCVTKILYPDIAKMHKSTPQRVEKALRHAIKLTWSNGILKNKDGYNFYVKDGRDYPTNSQFIAEMRRHIKMFPNYLTTPSIT